MDHQYQSLHHLIPFANKNAKARRHHTSQDIPSSSLNHKTIRLGVRTDQESRFLPSSPDFSSLDSVVPDMLASPGPMTNMDDLHNHRQARKSSVSFDFSNLPTSRDYLDLQASTPSDSSDTHSSDSEDDEVMVPSSPPSVPLSMPIPINGQILPPAILVALLDRDREMRELVQRNDQFFDLLRHHLADRGEDEWLRFERLLYLPREHIGDREWIEALGEFLVGTPAYWCKFKELVGYDDEDEEPMRESSPCRDVYAFSMEEALIEEEEEEEEEDGLEENKDIAEDNDGEDEYDDDDEIELARIRDAPSKLVRLQEAYPLFFEGAKRALAGSVSNSPNSSRRGSVVTGMMVDEARTEEEASELLDEMRARQEEREQDCEDNGESRLYREFVKLLMTSRREMDDEEWEASINDCLEGWPNLVAQLKEIVAFEVEESGRRRQDGGMRRQL